MAYVEELLLPTNKRLADYLHHKLCHKYHAIFCTWFDEIDDKVEGNIEDCWNEYAHKKCLEKANKLLEITDDEGLIKKIVDYIVK